MFHEIFLNAKTYNHPIHRLHHQSPITSQ